MSELNAKGVADAAAQNTRDKMPAASPLAAFQVEICPVKMMAMAMALGLQIQRLKRAVFGQAVLTARAEEELRYWKAKAAHLQEQLEAAQAETLELRKRAEA
jgi:hypothetical protein